jgi:N-acyl-phosphatidylethanolamine-hydrolysing phospholipase D
MFFSSTKRVYLSHPNTFGKKINTVGAYEPRDFMKSAHINPSEAVRIKDAIKAKRAIPIHWGTFHLAFEGVLKPKQDLELALERAQMDPKSFEPLDLGATVVVDTSI